jgi:hypothetical protein
MPLRVPGAAPASRCSSDASCLARQLFRPGSALTVPGAFRLRALARGPRGWTRVRTTWLDRTPPALSGRPDEDVVSAQGEVVRRSAETVNDRAPLRRRCGAGGST